MEDVTTDDTLDETVDDCAPAVSGPSLARGDEARTLPRIEGYRVVARLGEGGMGTVWRAVQLSTQREVALKLIASGPFLPPKLQARFEREVELAASLEHPNVARVYDSGLRHHTYYYAMELVEGQPLSLFVRSRKLPARQTVELFTSVCRAVQFAHQRGIIHRDLKPFNIMVTAEGVPKLLDFGLARSIAGSGASGQTITLSGEIAGTAAYMAPEQARGDADRSDTRTDVYALGVILYELLTGSLPHSHAGSLLDLLKKIAEQDAPRPRLACPAIDRELDAIVCKALSREPDRRYGSAGDLADDLARYVEGRPVTAKRHSAAYVLRKWTSRHSWAVGTAALVAAVLVGGLVAYVYNVRKAYGVTLSASVAAERQRQAAERHRDLAMETLRDLIFRVRRDLGRDGAQLQLQRNIIEQALTRLREIEDAQMVGSVEARAKADGRTAAAALLQMGDIFQAAGRAQDAERAYSRAAEVFDMLAEGSHPTVQALRESAVAHIRLARLHLRRDQVELSERHFDQARRAWQWLEATAQGRSLVRDKWVLLSGLADVRLRTKGPAQALPLASEAHALVAERSPAGGVVPFSDRDRSTSEKKLARVHALLFDADHDSIHLAPAKRLLEDAVLIDRRLAERSGPQTRRDLAVGLHDLGTVHVREGAVSEADACFREAVTLMGAVALTDPERADWQAELRQMRDALASTASTQQVRGGLRSAEEPPAAVALPLPLGGREPPAGDTGDLGTD